MNNSQLSVREIELTDLPSIAHYWTQSDAAYMKGMGVDIYKLPGTKEWISKLKEQLVQPYPQKGSYCLIWELNGKAVGHCNVNKIIFGEEAYMHLHMWHHAHRKEGFGHSFLKLSLPYFFNNLELKTLYCEPYALNAAPNKTLTKQGFRLLKSYTCIPGFICFEQEVNLWELKRSEFIETYA